MLEAMINDIAAVFRGVFLSGDFVDLVIAFGSALVASLLMSRGGQIGSMTLLALTLFALGGLLRGYFRAGAAGKASEGDRAAAQLEAGWSQLMTMQAGTLIAYFVAFMLMILILYFARSVIGGGR